MARPKANIDWNEFEDMCQLQCTLLEIAEHFNVHVDTLHRRIGEKYNASFSSVFRQKRISGYISLRRKQFQVAMAGSIPMLIFLGKNYLGQADKIEEKSTQEVTHKVITNDQVKDMLQNDPVFKLLKSA